MGPVASPSYVSHHQTPKKHLYVQHRFELNPTAVQDLRSIPFEFGFNGYGEAVYRRTYSRIKADGTQENWPDTILRVVNGIMSIRKDWYLKNNLPLDEEYWQDFAAEMGQYFIQMKCLPPGRGLWIMGTEYIYERGSMGCFNCGFTKLKNLSYDLGWLTDALMCGVGIGFQATNDPLDLQVPTGPEKTFIIPDSREGWVESIELLIRSYELGSNPINFDYSGIRPAGERINGFGGVSSGPKPLEDLHEFLRELLKKYVCKEMSPLRLRADAANAIGCMVVAGNIRRSAMLLLGSPDDEEFYDLKNYPKLNPNHLSKKCNDQDCRCRIGWIANHSAALRTYKDFDKIPEIAHRIRYNGEPGLVNIINVQRFGRYGKPMPDKADGVNPCAEILLEDKELCCLSETFPNKCDNLLQYKKALEFATFYASTVSLLPTHRSETNRVMARNRRIGVSLTGIADWFAHYPHSSVTRFMKEGYKTVCEINKKFAAEAGVPESVRKTTVKPSGSVSSLAGVSPGIHFPTFRYAVRRMRVAENAPIRRVLEKAGYPCEKDLYSSNTVVFEFPISHGKTRPATEVSIWEQASMVAMLQREWADNAVSVTLYYDPETEGDQLERVIAQTAPVIKTLSVLPHTDKGAYEQSPYEGITKEEYEERLSKIKPIDWSRFGGSDGDANVDKFCTGDSCQI